MLEILLVEDDAGDALLIRRFLKENPAPIRLHTARDGEQALGMLNNPDFKPGLVILDLNLPKISGLALLGRIESAKIPVVVFSSSVNPEDRKRSLALGAREFIQKPSGLDDFRAALLGIIQKWATPEAEANGAANGE